MTLNYSTLMACSVCQEICSTDIPVRISLSVVVSALSQIKCTGGILGTHAFRHTYRSWLDAAGTPVAVQQKLMRHSDIRTTMNIYGDVGTNEMGQAHSKVVGLLTLKQSA